MSTGQLTLDQALTDLRRWREEQIANDFTDTLWIRKRIEILMDSLWVCGQGHTVYVDAGIPPFELPTCPWCEVERLGAKLGESWGAEA